MVRQKAESETRFVDGTAETGIRRLVTTYRIGPSSKVPLVCRNAFDVKAMNGKGPIAPCCQPEIFHLGMAQCEVELDSGCSCYN